MTTTPPPPYEVLRRCAETFREYEALHRAKETEDGERKAQRNASMAALCEAAMASLTAPRDAVAEILDNIGDIAEMAGDVLGGYAIVTAIVGEDEEHLDIAYAASHKNAPAGMMISCAEAILSRASRQIADADCGCAACAGLNKAIEAAQGAFEVNRRDTALRPRGGRLHG